MFSVMNYQHIRFVHDVHREYDRARHHGGTDPIAMLVQSVAIGCLFYIGNSVARKFLAGELNRRLPRER